MKRVRIALATAVIAAFGVAFMPGAAVAGTCTPTGFYRDGINLTAAYIDPGTVTGTLDGSGCNIAVYYGPGTTGTVNGANISGAYVASISGANYYGVVVAGAAVNVTNSSISNIGENPLNGDQHGVAVFYTTLNGTPGPNWSNDAVPIGTAATGTLSVDTITNYQKNGVVVSGTGASVVVKGNTVTGQGPVPYIAQNGIEFGRGASGSASDNTVTGNQYTGANGASSGGFLVFGGPGYDVPYTTGITITNNTATNNDVGIFLSNASANGNAPSAHTNNTVKFNTITNDAVTNTTGDTATCGYQAGVSDLGTKDGIVNNSISGIGYTPITGDCGGTPSAFLRFIDAGSSARAVNSNK
jgi:hypothetical protein